MRQSALRDDESVARTLEFIAGLAVLGVETTENEKLRLAARVGMSTKEVERIFGKSPDAAQKALQRAKGGR